MSATLTVFATISVVVMEVSVTPSVASTMATSIVSAASVPLREVSLGVRVGHVGPVSVVALVCRASGATSILADFITHLTTCLATAKLTVRLEAIIPVDADDHAIEHLSVQSVDSESSLSPGGILDKTETTGLHLDTVETHD